MADLRDMQGAERDADGAQANLETYCGQIEDHERVEDMALVVGLSAVAICQRIHALAVRLDCLARDTRGR